MHKLTVAVGLVGIGLSLACGGLEVPNLGECNLPPAAKDPGPRAQSPARVNPGAIDGFESVDAKFDFVDADFPEVTGCHPEPHTQPLTNRPKPVKSAAASPYDHIGQLTFIPHESSPAQGDIFLHGDGPGYLALRDVDFRKFLYQDVILHDCDEDPKSCDDERLPGSGNVWKGAEKPPSKYANEPFDSDAFQCMRNIHGFFAEFNRITKKIGEHGGGGRLFHLTNNCREPGNYELALVSEDEEKLWSNHVSLDIEFYSDILEQIDVELGELGTGLRVVGTERNDDGSYEYDELQAKVFPEDCALVNLAPFIGKAQRLITPDPVPIRVEQGTIPWTEFSSETMEKSGRADAETIVYVEAKSKRRKPTGFDTAPFWFQEASDGVVERFNTEQGWRALAAASERSDVHAPHTFDSFADVQTRTFSLSAFEVDGRYLGRIPDERIDSDAPRLYSFDYGFLRRLNTAEVRVAIKPNGKPDTKPMRLEFRILDDRCTSKSCANIVVGNVVLGPGEDTSMVLGIGTQPLKELYDNDVQQQFQQYALTYDHNGDVSELEDYGLGLVVVRRGEGKTKDEFTIDLVSYERALPLWRGIVQVPSRRK